MSHLRTDACSSKSQCVDADSNRQCPARSDSGFTLVELLAVVVILGVLIAIAIPLYSHYRQGSNDAAASADLRHAISVLQSCQSETGTFPKGRTKGKTLPAGPVAGCSQSIEISHGTTLTYYPNKASKPASYVLYATNSAGSNKRFYC